MDEAMRRLLSIRCDGSVLGGSLDEAAGATGVLMVTGGSQTRVGSHRMYERLATALAKEGYCVFRFDRRGVGDSDREDPGFRGSAPDIAAAAATLRAECAHVNRIVGFGLCDGATALAMFGAGAGIDALILVNPWLVEAEAGQPPPAAIRRHYRERLLSREGWRKIVTGSISYRKLLQGILKIMGPSPATNLASDVATLLDSSRLPLALILSRKDATAIAAEEVWNGPDYRAVRERAGAPFHVETDSHTFARPTDAEALLGACLTALERLGDRDRG